MHAESGSRCARLVTAIAVGAALGAPPVCLAAQGKAEFTPFVGAYIPAGNLIDESGAVVKQKTTVIFGGRVGVSITDRLGIEGSFGYAPSKLEFSDASGSADTSAHVLLASARLLVGLGPAGKSSSWHLIVGGGLVSHGGAGWDAFEAAAGETVSGKTKFNGVAGIGGKFKVGSMVSVLVDVEDNLFSAKFSTSSGETQSKFNNDIVAGLGLAISLGK